MLGRHLRTFVTGAVFTLVGVGFAYAVPNSLGGARPPGRAHITLIEARDASGAGGGQHESDGTGSGLEHKEPAGSRPRTSQGAPENHGAAVRVAAHCDVRGRAHGELVRSIAGDKDATVAEAAAACEAAQAGVSEPGPGDGSPKKDTPVWKPSKPSKPDKTATRDKPTPVKSSKPAKPDKPAKPKPAKPAKPAPSDKPAKKARNESAPPQEAESDPKDKGPKKN